VPVFEELIRQSLLTEKFQKLVTDGISVGPAELLDEFRYKNEKVKLDYALIKPEDLEAKINPDEAEIKTFYDKNKSNYQVPERRVVRYALVDVNQIRQGIQVSDDQLKAQYQKNIQDYQVPNRVHVEHILLMTVGKTDAEVEEIKKKAEDVLKQARSGAKFEDLAKKYTEDPGTKDKGGDLGWLVQGQTVPEFEKAAFSLQKGQISDLVRTQYGFHIIKAIDKETAHTKSFDEVKETLRPELLRDQADKKAADTADQMSAAIRQSNKTSLDDLANQYHLTVSETRPVSATDPLIELANSKDAKDAIFRQRAGDLSLPIRTDRGYVVLVVKEIQPAHPGTLEEVRDKVVADLKRQKSIELARSKAEDLIKRVKAGEKFDPSAKGLGLDPKVSDLLARNGTIPGAASGKQLSAAFNLNAGEVGAPLTLGQNWLVYQVAEKQEPNPADFEKQKKDLTEEALQVKRSLAYEAFRTALDERLKQEGKLKLMPEKMKNFGSLG
jgi:peptidyl-prolyl cis-trans isomerase D